jgi:hypothetical protein
MVAKQLGYLSDGSMAPYSRSAPALSQRRNVSTFHVPGAPFRVGVTAPMTVSASPWGSWLRVRVLCSISWVATRAIEKHVVLAHPSSRTSAHVPSRWNQSQDGAEAEGSCRR